MLRKIFDRIDHDSSGTVSIDELVEGARKDLFSFVSSLQSHDMPILSCFCASFQAETWPISLDFISFQ